MASGDEARIRDTVASIVARRGFDLEDLVIRMTGRHRVIRVIIDRDGGVDLDVAAETSRAISAALDEQGDPVVGAAPYTLEVTSPGVGRPLTAERHFRRNRGRLVTVALADGSRVQGRILRCTGGALTLLTGKDGLTRRALGLTAVREATVDVEFSPPPAAVAAVLAEPDPGTDAGAETGTEVDEGTDAASDEAASGGGPVPTEGEDAR